MDFIQVQEKQQKNIMMVSGLMQHTSIQPQRQLVVQVQVVGKGLRFYSLISLVIFGKGQLRT